MALIRLVDLLTNLAPIWKSVLTTNPHPGGSTTLNVFNIYQRSSKIILKELMGNVHSIGNFM